MRCETCRGDRYIVHSKHEAPRPCETCGGSGIDYCCGTVCEQPEPPVALRYSEELLKRSAVFD